MADSTIPVAVAIKAGFAISTSERDQWAATVRDILDGYGVSLADRDARHAFILGLHMGADWGVDAACVAGALMHEWGIPGR